MRFGELFVEIGTSGNVGPRRSRGPTTAPSWSSRPTKTADARCSPSTQAPRGHAATPMTTSPTPTCAPRRAACSTRCAASYASPPHPVRIDPDGTVTALPCVELPPAWRPDRTDRRRARRHPGPVVVGAARGDAPAPLLLWIHGGPLASWNAWHWRWNPWVLAAQGYAVLMPDPALSTGYGQDFIQRGWGAWGFAPYTDLMAATDAACAHPRVDGHAPQPWAARSAATWPTGSRATPTASTPSSRTPACGARPVRAHHRRRLLVGPRDDREMAEQNSPHRHVGPWARRCW